MEISSNMLQDNLLYRKVESLNQPQQIENQKTEEQNPNTLQNVQEQILRDAVQGPTSPTAQGTQILATTMAVSSIQATASQQIRSGFLDIRI
ncbi:hypothetical protein MASR1M45_31250 [Candidatus Kapaibacterium sp.]